MGSQFDQGFLQRPEPVKRRDAFLIIALDQPGMLRRIKRRFGERKNIALRIDYFDVKA